MLRSAQWPNALGRRGARGRARPGRGPQRASAPTDSDARRAARLDVDARRDQLWVTIDGSSRVEVRNAATGRLVARPDLGVAPHDVVVAPNNSTIWFSNWSSGELTVVSLRSRRAAAHLRAGTGPHHFAFGLYGLWISVNAAGSVVTVDPAARRIVRSTEVGLAPHHIAVAGVLVLVAIHGRGRVAVVSRKGRLVDSIAVGDGPHGIAAVRLGR